jgi:nucleoside-diphosphate-sugar epimerase
MKKVLVTGAAGFLGSHLCDSLLEKGYQVLGIDNFFRGKKENLPVDDLFVFQKIDCLDITAVRMAFDYYNPDIVIHYAAINGTRYFYDIPYQVCDENIKMTQNILTCCDEYNIEKIVYASSSEVYGPNPKVPTKEIEPIELYSHAVRDSYASSKAIGEFLVKLWAELNNKDYLIIRPFNTYGPRMATNGYGQVIPEFIERIKSGDDFYMYGDGKQTRSFCYVTDHADIVTDLILKSKNEILNIGYDEEVSIHDLAKKIHDIMSIKFEPIYKDAWSHDTKWRKPDISGIKKYVDKKYINLFNGLNKMIKEYKYE